MNRDDNYVIEEIFSLMHLTSYCRTNYSKTNQP